MKQLLSQNRLDPHKHIHSLFIAPFQFFVVLSHCNIAKQFFLASGLPSQKRQKNREID